MSKHKALLEHTPKRERKLHGCIWAAPITTRNVSEVPGRTSLTLRVVIGDVKRHNLPTGSALRRLMQFPRERSEHRSLAHASGCDWDVQILTPRKPAASAQPFTGLSRTGLKQLPQTTFSKWAVVLSLLLLFFPVSLPAQVFDQREQSLVGGLRDRGLFEFAEMHCQQVLEREGLTKTDHALLAVERIRNQTAIARTSANRETQWQLVDQVADEFSARHSENPKAVLVSLQQALAHVAFANQLQQEVKAKIGSTEIRRGQGLEQLVSARKSLDRTKQLALKTMKAQSNQNLSADMLSNEQLRVLETNVAYQQAIVNLTSAQLVNADTEEGRLNRLDSLGRVPEQLAVVRNSVAKSRPLWWKTWIREATCRRMLGEFGSAQNILTSLKQKGRPNSVDSIWMREQIELVIDADDQAAMQRVANAAMQQRYEPETEVALVRLLVSLGKVESASRVSRNIGASYGPWWARRADIALLEKSKSKSLADSTVGAAGARMLLEAAEKAQQQGDFAAAAQGFQSVAETQFSNGDAAGGLATSVRAAMAFEKQGKHQEAAKTLLVPSKANSSEKLASSIHLRGCWNLSKASDPAFAAETKWHIEKWPQSESANQSRFWLASKQIAKQEYRVAFETLADSQSTSPQFPANVKLARYACRKLLDEAESAKRATRSLAMQFLQIWKDVYASCEETSKPAVAVAMSELAVGWGAEDFDSARRTMEALNGLSSTKSNLEFQYLSLILDSSRKGRKLSDISSSVPIESNTVIQFVKLLDRLETSKSISSAKLAIVEDLIARSKDSELEGMLKFSKAKALAGIGKKQEASAILKRLVQEDSRNQKVLVYLAELSSDSEALNLWRSIAARSPAQSKTWFSAKFNVARLLHESGKSSEAEKMLKYIKAVPPGWENSELKSKFESLLRTCSGK